ncbi:sensor histidine kinase KdpD [Acinetobacter bereziniae]|uniref:sensor histidine kinase n=2 Tax=Acinetobacter bereziniae TaxID=106648 RepID=UPI001580C83B|nr:sensor histidine kinase KdpD [Acinetobacter bereziniae]NUF61761.1 sensor histidine kinase KdpD [Acinetobacter bereziniae]NUG06458.1 sensor histidine kinase KdpD [Acinetobacter bereziniae]NUG63040.1 sensor histidine kinase KdpD [Acinetobacter bereziniae]NUG68787.1 sensor histidine kinase KdpD [Acinetobacter bereziniae]WEI23855.1 sensor histidine kinase KdpD [Acinetobacter bereziniae]
MVDDRNNKADVLLQHTQRYQSGRLTIFLGAAPGVGKTFAMLVRAHELALQGNNIVIGYVETHGRVETENLLAGLKIIPRKVIEYQGHQLEEMDLDAVLATKPSIALVDEFAHSNMPNSRHEKRWQDINELLDAGIDVFTTMNIQHLESLNDVVFQITGIRVAETVPDRVFERIRDIRLIDLPVSELLERLNQGKVYVPEQAQQALQRFFNHSNLTALRELAMQTVASHVDSDVRENFSIQGLVPIPLKNHILIMLDGGGHAEALVRAGCRIAENRQAHWTVVAFSEDSQIHYKSENSQQREIERALNLTRQLGGMTEILYGKQHAKTLFDYVIDRGISTLVLTQSKAKSFQFHLKFKQNFVDQLLKYQPSFELSMVPIVAENKPYSTILEQSRFLNLREIFYVLSTTVMSIFIASLGEKYLGIEELSVIFITAVVFVASKTRMLAAVFSAILFFLAYNFFFITPKFTFQISAHQGVITVVAFLGAALISSRLASRLKEQVVALKAANSYNSIMQDLGQKLSVAVDLKQVQEIAENSLSKNLNAEIWFYFPGLSAEVSPLLTISDKEKISADWTFKNHQPSGRFTQTLTENDWWFLPLLASKQCLGVVGIKFPKHLSVLNTEQKQLTETMIEYIAQAISRTQLSKALEIANINSETEKLRSALLSSVSHDLRSPLASMIGAADTLTNYRHSMDEQDQDSLLEAIRLEGERLDRYIQNLLDMTRLGHEGLSLKRDWIGVDELIGSAVRRLKRYMPHSLVEVHLPEQSLSLYVHAALIEQAIFNVLENAAKFSPEHKAVCIDVVQCSENEIEIAISDQGQGIPEDERERIFDMFYTMERGDRGQYGTGLGLTIVKAIIGAHMGKIMASSAKNNQGTCIRMQLPIQQIG